MHFYVEVRKKEEIKSYVMVMLMRIFNFFLSKYKSLIHKPSNSSRNIESGIDGVFVRCMSYLKSYKFICTNGGVLNLIFHQPKK